MLAFHCQRSQGFRSEQAASRRRLFEKRVEVVPSTMIVATRLRTLRHPASERLTYTKQFQFVAPSVIFRLWIILNVDDPYMRWFAQLLAN